MLDGEKLAGICTDSCPAMIGKNNGAVTLVLAELGCAPDQVISMHCIIHHYVLCAKVLHYEHVMKVVVSIINLIRSQALNHRLFKEFLEEKDAGNNDLLYHTAVRWLSRGASLSRFVSLLDEIKEFLPTRSINKPELLDEDWLCDLAFLTDITGHIDILNKQLQGNDHLIADLVSAVKSFQVSKSQTIFLKMTKFIL